MKTLDKIRALRKLCGFTYEQMGEKLCITSAAYGKIERGETALYLARIEQLAAIFKVTVQELSDENFLMLLTTDADGNFCIRFVSANCWASENFLLLKKEIDKLYNFSNTIVKAYIGLTLTLECCL